MADLCPRTGVAMSDHVPDPFDPQDGDIFEYVSARGKVSRGRVRIIPSLTVIVWFEGHGPGAKYGSYDVPKGYLVGQPQMLTDRMAGKLRPRLPDLDPEQAIAELAADLAELEKDEEQ